MKLCIYNKALFGIESIKYKHTSSAEREKQRKKREIESKYLVLLIFGTK